MTMEHRITRRSFCAGVAGVAATSAFPLPALAQGPARIVVIGGGFGGASAARALRGGNPNLHVTLVEPNAVFTACPFSNGVIADEWSIEEQEFTYEKVAAAGITIAPTSAVKIDTHIRSVGLADGTSLSYDRLILSPGIDFRF